MEEVFNRLVESDPRYRLLLPFRQELVQFLRAKLSNLGPVTVQPFLPKLYLQCLYSRLEDSLITTVSLLFGKALQTESLDIPLAIWESTPGEKIFQEFSHMERYWADTLVDTLRELEQRLVDLQVFLPDHLSGGVTGIDAHHAPNLRQSSHWLVSCGDKAYFLKRRHSLFEESYLNLLGWLAREGHLPELPADIEILTGMNCSLMEDLRPLYEKFKSDAESFYHNLGLVTPFLFTLGCSQLDAFNLFAVGNIPLFANLSRSFLPAMRHDKSQLRWNQSRSRTLAQMDLLPKKVFQKKYHKYFDIGGITAGSQARFAIIVESWQARLENDSLKLQKVSGHPRLYNRPHASMSRAVEDHFGIGYEKGVELLLKHKESVFGDQGIFTDALHHTIACDLRMPSPYSELMRSLQRRRVVQSRQQVTEWLGCLRDNNKGFKRLVDVADVESAVLIRGERPRFEANMQNTHVSCSGVALENLLWSSPQKEFKEFLNWELSSAHLHAQGILAERALSLDVKLYPAASATELDMKVVRDFILKALMLETRSPYPLHRRSDPMKGDFLAYMPLNLENGVLGTALCLYYFTAILDKRLTAECMNLHQFLARRIEQDAGQYSNVGWLSGLGSAIYYLAHFGHLSGRDEPLRHALQLAEGCRLDFEKMFSDLSIGKGIAGLLLALHSLYSITHHAGLGQMIRQMNRSCLEQLKERADTNTSSFYSSNWGAEWGCNRVKELMERTDGFIHSDRHFVSNFFQGYAPVDLGLLSGVDGRAYFTALANARTPLPNLFLGDPPL